MPENFEIRVIYKGKEHSFPASLISTGYNYKIQVDVLGKTISFEPDEERNWRAVIPYEEIDKNKNLNKDLLNAIAISIDNTVDNI